MDNQMFSGGAPGPFLEDMPHICTLCGMLFNNALLLQRHMQMHILTNVQMLVSQPQPDPVSAVGLPSGANILDLLGGINQHGISSIASNPGIHPQGIASISSIPPHLITPDISTSGHVSIPQPVHQVRPVREKAARSQSVKSTSNTVVTSSSATPGVRSNATKSRDTSTFLSSFSKDVPKLDTTPSVSSTVNQQSVIGSIKDSFLTPTSQFDPLEALITSPTKLICSLDNSSSDILGKDSKLFQPFSSSDTQGSVHQLPTTFVPSFTAESLISPVKSVPNKATDFDVLSTPQKLHIGSTENLISLVSTQASTSTVDVRHFGLNQETSSITTDSQPFKLDDKTPLKPQFFPGVMDHINISPKIAQHPRKKELDPSSSISSAPVSSLDLSRSSSPESKTRSGEYLSRHITSPKISPALPTDIMDSDLPGLSSKSHTFGGAPDILPGAAIAAAVPKPFGSAQASTPGVGPAVPSPAIDMAVNPLGTGYFNALTSKLIDPTFSLCPDFTKSSSSGVNPSDDSTKSKTFYENGILINQDYDKISDTNDEDDLERLIDGIDTKVDNIDTDTKGISEIEELLNEFNDKHPEDLKQKSTPDDDFFNVLGEPKSKATAETSSKAEDVYHPPDPIEMNQSAIAELLEKEMEIIDMETKEVEKSRLSAVSNLSISSSDSSPTTSTVTTTATSTSAVSTTSSTSTVSTPLPLNSEPKPSLDGEPKSSVASAPEEPVDFEIPKVGKLMKIRKYQEIQKRREQTAEKDVEIKVHEKKEPVVPEKPQTILVQVSKRKKIEYGPYINKQSLLEGKPKVMESTTTNTTSPLKSFKPKPKPQVPTRRTFNLRERKRTDFATLAGTQTRTADQKKGEEKNKNEKGLKTNKDEGISESTEAAESTQSEENRDEEPKIVTRKQEKAKKETEKSSVDKKKGKGAKANETEKESKTIEEDEGKPNLRTRSAKAETETYEGKTLRKRALKTTPESSKAKVKKVEINSDSEEKLTRSKVIKKVTSDKNEIKKCSVNLGEKYTETKIKFKKLEKEESKKDTENTDLLKDTEDKIADINSVKDSNKDCVSGKIKESTNIFEKIEQQVIKKDIPEEQKDSVARVDEYESQNDKILTEKIVTTEKSIIGENTVISFSTGSDKKVTVKFKFGPDLSKCTSEIVSAPKKRKLNLESDTGIKSESFLKRKDLEQSEDVYQKKETESSESQDLKTDIENSVKMDQTKGDEPMVVEGPQNDTVENEKKTKHSVENEFQRLVDEAMAQVKKEGESGKQERYVNLRKRLNESIKYNVDDSDEELDKLASFSDIVAKGQRVVGKPVKGPIKGTQKGTLKIGSDSAVGQSDIAKQTKKDVDVYDFTDTEMSDHEDSSQMKMGFKPKYVSNLSKGPLNPLKLPFVSTPLSVESKVEEEAEIDKDLSNAEEKASNEDEPESEISYVGKTVEPLKIKLTKIKPFKEKKHKHKKKKKKRDRSKEREEKHSEYEERSMDVSEVSELSAIDDSKCKVEEIKSVESIGNETTSNEGDDESAENGGKQSKKTKLKEKKHLCEYCNVGFSQKCDLRRHVMIHTGERPWPCEICDKRFQRKTDLAKHMRTHTGEKPYACEFCDKRVSDKSQLNVHRRLHTGDRPYECSKCGKRCITSSELSRHRAVRCSDNSDIIQCGLCKKKFTIKECLGMHMKLHYRSKGRPFKCDKCAIGFDKKTALDMHNCVDPTSNVYVCSECYEEFTDEMLYADHIKTHDLGVLACNVCTLIFPDKHSLETHLCTMGEDKPRILQCEICDMEFQDNDMFTQHVAAHDNDSGNFMCDLCSDMFTVRRHLKEHSCSKENSQLGVKGELEKTLPKKSNDIKNLNSHNILDKVFSGNNSLVTDFKQEPKSCDDTTGLSSSPPNSDSENILTLSKFPLTTVKTEDIGLTTFPRQRASVISGTFNVDSDSRTEHSDSMDSAVLNPTKKKDKSVRNISKPGFSQSQSHRFFDTSEFSNSPDFSSLTEDDHHSFDPFLRTKENNSSAVDNKNTGDAFAQSSAEKLAIGKQFPHSKQENILLSFGGALKQRPSVSQSSSAIRNDMRGNHVSSDVESARPSVVHSQPGQSPTTGGGKHSILQSAITSRIPGGFQMNPLDYVNYLSKAAADSAKQKLPPKTLSQHSDGKSPVDIKSGNRSSAHSVLDMLKSAPSSGSHLKTQLQSGLDLKSQSPTQNPPANVLKSKFLSNKSDLSSGKSHLTSQGAPSSRHRQPADLSIFAQSYLSHQLVPGSMSNVGNHPDIAKSSAGQDKGRRHLSNLLGVSDTLPSGFMFNVEDHVKDSDKKQDEGPGLLSHF